MGIDASFFQEEERSGFLVTEKRKKVWAVELEILEQFDEVCKKYGFTYYVHYGTLLGAVRHQGFVPWDDDVDVVMFRDEYQRFQEIASQEFCEPYFYQNSYTDQIFWPFSKIRDGRTTAIERSFMDLGDTFHQGICIDLFPMDSVLDGVNEQFLLVEEIRRLLWRMVSDPVNVLTEMKNGMQFILERDFMLEILRMDQKLRFKVFEDFNESHFGETEELNYIMSDMRGWHSHYVRKEWYQETVYLPFEHLQVPAPAEFDKVLTRVYGDYHKLVRGTTEHEGIILEPEISYREYFKRYL